MAEMTLNKIILQIDECVPGMVLMQSVMDEKTGTTIASKGQVLTQEIIDKLGKFKTTQIWISLEAPTSKNEETVWKVDEKTFKTYQGYAKLLETIFKEQKSKVCLSIDKVIEITESIMNEFEDCYSLLSCINLLNQMKQDEYMHCVNVACTAFVLGKWLNYDTATLKDIVIASLLHDVGKLDINPILFDKKEKEMSDMERLEYRRHPICGYEKLVPYNELNVNVLKGILMHHERCDGSGFPLCLRANRIVDIAKVIAIADTYNELRNNHHIFEIVKILETKMIRKLDANMLFRFCNNIMNYYTGAKVELNNGKVGEIVFIQSQVLHRPIIEVQGEYINLCDKPHLEIVKVI